MKRICTAVVLALLASGASAQVFKWVDERGVTHYSDVPPTTNVKKVEIKNLDGSGSSVELPWAVAEAVRTAPVTLYTTTACQSCDDGRKLLNERGVPFSEKTVNTQDDMDRLKAAGSDGKLPLLVVGGNRLIGFEAGSWNEALSAANYPSARVLPPSFKQAKAESAAPPRPSKEEQARAAAAAAAAKAEADAEAKRDKLPPPPKDAPPGFKF